MNNYLSNAVIMALALVACGPPELAEQTEEETSASSLSALMSQSSPAAFSDTFDYYNTSLWYRADDWSDGGFFDVGWRGTNTRFSGGSMTLVLNNDGCPSGCSGERYASGEYFTLDTFSYGFYEIRMKAAKGSGVVSSFFIGSWYPHDEIDIEFLGKDTTKMQTNYWKDGVGGHETLVPLGFDASAAFHNYLINWTSTSIEWWVDGVLRYRETGRRGPLPQHPGNIAMNLWTSQSKVDWLGPFTYTGPVSASYTQLRFVRH